MKAITLSMQSEVLPEDYPYFLVLDDNLHPESTTWNNPWYLAIVGKHGEIIEQSTQGHPSMRSALFGECFESGILYGVAGTLMECQWWKSFSLDDERSRQYDKDTVLALKAQDKPKAITGPIDNLSKEISVKQSDRKVAQSQAAINSAKITQLEKMLRSAKILQEGIPYGAIHWARATLGIEKELKQARELQKLLKKLR